VQSQTSLFGPFLQFSETYSALGQETVRGYLQYSVAAGDEGFVIADAQFLNRLRLDETAEALKLRRASDATERALFHEASHDWNKLGWTNLKKTIVSASGVVETSSGESNFFPGMYSARVTFTIGRASFFPDIEVRQDNGGTGHVAFFAPQLYKDPLDPNGTNPKFDLYILATTGNRDMEYEAEWEVIDEGTNIPTGI
jgi:hypothetical protein